MKFIKVTDYSADPQIKILHLNRPDVRNAFHPEMISELTTFFQSAAGDGELKAIIVRGEGSAFCAGADLNWMKSMVNFSKEENLEDSKKLWAMFESIQNCPVPVVAVAHGSVFGGALGILTACDYVFAEANTQLCFSEVKLGLAPAVISGFITRKIQDAFVRPLMLSAEVFKAENAREIGLVHKVYSGSVSDAEVVKMFSGNGFQAMRETKKLLNQLLSTADMTARRALCAAVITERRMSEEGQARLKAFLNK